VAHLLLDGSANTDAVTADLAAHDISGDIDVRVRGSADDWTPVTDFLNPLSRWSGALNSWYLALRSNGRLIFQWKDSGAITRNATSSVATGISDGEVGWIRATLDVDNGAGGCDVTFYTSADGETPSWSQLGTVQTQAFTTDILTGTGGIYVGSRFNGGWWAGKVLRAQVLNGIDGTLVFDADFSDPTTWVFS
jgi:hypothetical protein